MTKKLNFKGRIVASFILILGLGLLLCFKLVRVSATNDIDSEMKNQVSQKVQAWIAYYSSKDSIMMSSAPYSYIENDKFQEIKNLGPEYLPYILKEIENEPAAVFALWNLREITKVKDLPDWDSDVQCVSIWNNYIDNLPSKLNELKEDLYAATDEQEIKIKTQEIVDLGYPVLPLIIEEDNIKMDEVEEALFAENINEISYENLNKDNKENIKINDEAIINKKIHDYKVLVKKNKKIKELESFKIKRSKD
jgi:hypothetical protein